MNPFRKDQKLIEMVADRMREADAPLGSLDYQLNILIKLLFCHCHCLFPIIDVYVNCILLEMAG